MRSSAGLLFVKMQQRFRRSRWQAPTERHCTMNNKHLFCGSTCDGRVTTQATFEGANSDVGIKTGGHRSDVDDFRRVDSTVLLLMDVSVFFFFWPFRNLKKFGKRLSLTPRGDKRLFLHQRVEIQAIGFSDRKSKGIKHDDLSRDLTPCALWGFQQEVCLWEQNHQVTLPEQSQMRCSPPQCGSAIMSDWSRGGKASSLCQYVNKQSVQWVEVCLKVVVLLNRCRTCCIQPCWESRMSLKRNIRRGGSWGAVGFNVFV